MLFVSVKPCNLGYALIASNDHDHLIHVELGNDSKNLLSSFIEREKLNAANHPVTDATNEFHRRILNIVDGEQDFNISMLLWGTNFQLDVWEALLHVPAGKTVTYKDIAKTIGNPKAVRAVGTAIGKNPIAILVPCHRIIRSDGNIGEYRWGTEIKNKLLMREKQSLK